MARAIRKMLSNLGYDGSKLQITISKWLSKKRKKQRHKNLELYGCEMLDVLFKAVAEAGGHIWLEWGTLLGAYREKSFIGHDYDCDTGILASDYNVEFDNTLLKYGFHKKHALYLINRETGEKTLTELTYSYKEFEVDMTFSFIKDGKRIIYAPYSPKCNHAPNEYEVHAYTHDTPLPTEDITINNHVYQAPHNPKSVLETTYGPTFMTPDPNFVTCAQYLNVDLLDFNKIYATIYGEW